MKAAHVLALCVALLPTVAWGDERRLEEWLDAGAWGQGADYCSRSLVPDIARRPDLRNVSAATLSGVAVRCAALSGQNGDEAGAAWWWFTAVALDLETAQRLLPALRERGLLSTLPPPRSRTPSLPRRSPEETKEVLLPSGATVPGVPARPKDPPKMPDFMFRRIPGIAGWIVTVEVVVSKEGVPRQPLLAQVGGLPVHLLFAFHSLGAWRFEPAQVDGEPVESIYTLTISNRRG